MARRFSHFAWLHQHLRAPQPLGPPLTTLPNVLPRVEAQRCALEAFLQAALADPAMARLEALQDAASRDTLVERTGREVENPKDIIRRAEEERQQVRGIFFLCCVCSGWLSVSPR